MALFANLHLRRSVFLWRFAHLVGNFGQFVGGEAFSGDDEFQKFGLFGVGVEGGFQDAKQLQQLGIHRIARSGQISADL